MTTDDKIALIENEMTCVRRKIATNCSDCANCDLVMDDADILSTLGDAIAALRRTAEDDKASEEGRLVVLPFPLHSNAIHTVDPTERLNDLRLSVTWTSESSVIFSAPLGIFTQQLADGLVKLTRQEAEAALGGGEGG